MCFEVCECSRSQVLLLMTQYNNSCGIVDAVGFLPASALACLSSSAALDFLEFLAASELGFLPASELDFLPA